MNRFKNLDSIRTIAFVSTFMAHNFDTTSDEVKNTLFFSLVNGFREIFSFGVPLFFVLSGFLITYLMLFEYEKKGTFNIKNFYVRRILRIWPVYYLVLVTGFILFPLFRQLVLHEPTVETANPWMYILFLSNFDQLHNTLLPTGVGLGVTWSVAVEEQFYLFWPLIFLVLKGKRFIYGMFTLFVLSVTSIVVFYLPAKHTIFCIMYLSTGGILAYIHYYKKELSQKLTRIPWYAFVFILIACLVIMKNIKTIPGIISPLGYLSISLLMGYIILYQIQCSDKMNLKKIPGFEFWGKYTYGLYLYHTICNFIAFTIVKQVHLYDHLGSFYTDMVFRPATSMTLSLMISYFSYHYFEAYFLRLKSKFSYQPVTQSHV